MIAPEISKGETEPPTTKPGKVCCRPVLILDQDQAVHVIEDRLDDLGVVTIGVVTFTRIDRRRTVETNRVGLPLAGSTTLTGCPRSTPRRNSCSEKRRRHRGSNRLHACIDGMGDHDDAVDGLGHGRDIFLKRQACQAGNGDSAEVMASARERPWKAIVSSL